jgi:hypothetical protein
MGTEDETVIDGPEPLLAQQGSAAHEEEAGPRVDGGGGCEVSVVMGMKAAGSEQLQAEGDTGFRDQSAHSKAEATEARRLGN